MKHGEQWLSWASELQSLAQAGLYYGRDKFDLERYARIREIAAEMVAHQADLPLEQGKGWFCNETGYQTPKLATREEAGLEVRADRVIALQDGENHHETVYPWKVCIVFVLCTLLGGEFRENLETSESGWFSLNELPELDLEKTTPEQLRMCFEARKAEHWETRLE